MSHPLWLLPEDIAAVHAGVIKIGGGAEGIRDEGLLASALARPLNLFSYGETDLFQLAASYAEAISRNHPFIDGNKRTGFMAAVLFLDLNGVSVDAAQGHEHADMMAALAQGKLSREAAAAHFRAHCTAGS